MNDATQPDAWRTRAEQAEQRLSQLEAQLASASKEVEAAKASLDAGERRRQIERELADTVDLETTVLLTEAAVAAMDAPDVPAAVADLRRRKPFLFRSTPGVPVMSGAARHDPDPLADAASAARQSGDRRALLRYLRLKRGT